MEQLLSTPMRSLAALDMVAVAGEVLNSMLIVALGELGSSLGGTYEFVCPDGEIDCEPPPGR